ncbi:MULTISPECIES: DUF4430 domain-containing protein [unclassified Enterococcus]|uniref:DUF4430 domain-containing protein n=1 Tax=unclassified Enterococcus TaxID=2608891 RepID=UPI0015555383|nr:MULTISPECIES: DUF4430 domain-containing protein [unclassified Enterococcus]MBS7578004.1 DUF4430 domain-containing protein [Enterococcus sp. MMGLQ5-2]MBS7585306.1 DUF4430 domain-containing protein [Enterococcus sp. MMGLQ5-1]NPD13163.1 DUF4430 domain-containing protein [Enterococcus sp. MMGLQ5-1]NPD37835.1 DUF4430 domain-containing protein [Enterococcus sp. MMGLQ5-2]
MKKILTGIVVTLLFTTGCASQNNQTKETSTSQTEMVKVEVTLTKEGSDTVEKQVEAKKGTNLLDLMTTQFKAKADNGFITEINGWAQDEAAGKYWLFKVNGTDSQVGAKEVKLKNGDQYDFRLEAMQ